MAESLLLDLHGRALRRLAEHLGLHPQGLYQATRLAVRQGTVSSRLARRLAAVETALAMVRHITRPLVRSILGELEAELTAAGGGFAESPTAPVETAVSPEGAGSSAAWPSEGDPLAAEDVANFYIGDEFKHCYTQTEVQAGSAPVAARPPRASVGIQTAPRCKPRRHRCNGRAVQCGDGVLEADAAAGGVTTVAGRAFPGVSESSQPALAKGAWADYVDSDSEDSAAGLPGLAVDAAPAAPADPIPVAAARGHVAESAAAGPTPAWTGRGHAAAPPAPGPTPASPGRGPDAAPVAPGVPPGHSPGLGSPAPGRSAPDRARAPATDRRGGGGDLGQAAAAHRQRLRQHPLHLPPSGPGPKAIGPTPAAAGRGPGASPPSPPGSIPASPGRGPPALRDGVRDAAAAQAGHSLPHGPAPGGASLGEGASRGRPRRRQPRLHTGPAREEPAEASVTLGRGPQPHAVACDAAPPANPTPSPMELPMDDLDLLDVVAGQGDEHDRLHLQARASRAAVFAAIEELATLRGIVVPPGTGLRQALVMVQSYAAVNTLD